MKTCSKAYGDLNPSYLASICETANKALSQYSRVFAFRIDLRFMSSASSTTVPGIAQYTENNVITYFIKNLKYLIKTHLEHRRNYFGFDVENTKVRYVWAREQNNAPFQHYHCLILLNKNSFKQLGFYGSEDGKTLASLIQIAWARAIGVQDEAGSGLVEFCDGIYYLDRNNTDQHYPFLLRAGYLAKEHSKNRNKQYRSFGCSQS